MKTFVSFLTVLRMSALHAMAWFVIGMSVIKLAVVLVKPKAWVNGVVKTLYAVPLIQWICMALAAAGLYWLAPTLTMVQFFGALFVFVFLYMAALAPYAKEFTSAMTPMLSNPKTLWKKSWPITVFWVVLMAMAVKELLA